MKWNYYNDIFKLICSVFVIILFTQTVSSQVIYSDGQDDFIVSLGEHKRNLLKVYKQGKITFMNKQSLQQVEQYNTQKFMNFLEKEGLEFWLVHHKTALSQLTPQKLFYYYDAYSSWFNLAFQSQDGSVYGFIHFNHYSKQPCQYEVTVNINSKIVEDNLMIVKKEKHR